LALFNIGVCSSGAALGRGPLARGIPGFHCREAIAIGSWGWGHLTDIAGVETRASGLLRADVPVAAARAVATDAADRRRATRRPPKRSADPEVRLSLTGAAGP